MATEPSPYARAAGRLRDMGYHAMPAKPGEKVPGHFDAGRWSYMALAGLVRSYAAGVPA